MPLAIAVTDTQLQSEVSQLDADLKSRLSTLDADVKAAQAAMVSAINAQGSAIVSAINAQGSAIMQAIDGVVQVMERGGLSVTVLITPQIAEAIGLLRGIAGVVGVASSTDVDTTVSERIPQPRPSRPGP